MGEAHSHDHSGGHRRPVPPRVQRLLTAALVPIVAFTAVGLVVLWPGSGRSEVAQGAFSNQVRAVVREVQPRSCPDVPGQENFRCARVTVEVAEGADEGHSFTFDYSNAPNAQGISKGDRIVVARGSGPAEDEQPAESQYFFVDFDRRLPLALLGIVFAIVVILLSRWRGLAALAGLAVSLLVLVKFVLPAILAGESPVAVAFVGGTAIMLLALYLAHGVNAATTTAVLGTFASLSLTVALSQLFVAISSFTGVGSEEATYLQITQQQVNLEGLLLASIIIGTLGVLDDVTITQASAVWELHGANPAYGTRDLYRAAIRIGRDHIASTVNTLVLAYAGASLPLLILFTLANRSFAQVVNTEIVAEEVVRTLVGSIGLVASVPITTGLASIVVTRGAKSGTGAKRRPSARKEDAFKVPRAEREWRGAP